jgi:hypothetical protein
MAILLVNRYCLIFKKQWTNARRDLINNEEYEKMKELIIMLGIAGVWILLQAYILPKLGIST